MSKKIRIGIVGYGNLGKGVEKAIKQNDDMELVAVFTRRDAQNLKINTQTAKVLNIEEIQSMIGKIDVMILCMGSAIDLPQMAPKYAKLFNTIDSFDTHAKIPEYHANMDEAAKEGKNISIISVGWDPGLFSINRMYNEAILPNGVTYTFWGKGVSQGHSEAIRHLNGVKNAVQYTIPIEEAINKVRRGENPEFKTREKHLRECFVVLDGTVEKEIVEKEIKEMPNYFLDYETIVHFISEDELKQNHNKMPHGGFVIRSGKTGEKEETKQLMEFSLKLESNPEFTSSVLVCYARAIMKLKEKGEIGAKTVLDIPPIMLSNKKPEQLRKELL